MDRVKGLPSLALIAAGVLLGLRLVHLGLPILFPGTRPGPMVCKTLDEARRRAGFGPIVPTDRPAALGDRPTSIAVLLSPEPTIIVVWRRGEQYLSVTQKRGGAKPPHPAGAAPLDQVAESTWWTAGSQHHLIVWRVGFWIEIATNLPAADLKRLADTLTLQ